MTPSGGSGSLLDDEIAAVGIRLLHMQMPVTFDPEVVRRFARGLAEVVVVEEKNPTLELLVKDALYGLAERPAVRASATPTAVCSWPRPACSTPTRWSRAYGSGSRHVEDRITPAAAPVC